MGYKHLFFLLCLGVLSAQEVPNLKFKHFSTNEGLTQRSVTSIIQDSNGYLWFGTRDGLNKFDGYSFKEYRHNSTDINSLGNSKIITIFEDAHKDLWIGTRNGLNKYNSKEDNFIRFGKAKTIVTSFGNQIISIAQLDTENLWIGTQDGLEKFNIEEKTSIYYKHQKNNRNGLSSNNIIKLLGTKENKLWITTATNIDFYDPVSNTFSHFQYPHRLSYEQEKITFATLFEDNKKNIWLGTDEGLSVFDKKQKSFIFFNIDSNKHNITKAVRTICEDSQGNLWIGAYNGLFFINKERTNITHIKHDENNPNSLSQNSIYKIIEDSRGDLWIGTWGAGVNYLDRSYNVFKQFSQGISNNSLNYKIISSIVEDPNENLWIGTEGGGINFYDKKTNKFTYYTHQKSNLNSLSDDNVKAMIQDVSGNIWVGTHGGGLNVFQPNKMPNTSLKYKNILKNSNSLKNYKITCLFEDFQNDIWIGTIGSGVQIFHQKYKEFTNLKDPQHILSTNILTITGTSDKKHVYIGGDKGIVKVNIVSKTLNKLQFYNNGSYFNFSSQVLTVYEDESNNLWIGTDGNGLHYYDNSTKKITKYGTRFGLPSEVIYGILPGEKDYIWFSTNKGLVQMNTITKEFRNFDKEDGLQGNEFNFGAFTKTKKQELVFGGTNGITFFNPRNIRKNTFIPRVHITSLHVKNIPYLNIDKSLKQITLNHTQNVFNFDFVALSYSQPTKNRYAYKLEGFDSKWNHIGNNRSATYTNIGAGRYTFKVKASNGDELWSNEDAYIELIILPAPWKTWWAYLLYTLLSAIIIWIITKYIRSKIRLKNELIQERLEKETLEEINQIKLRMFTNISHEFRTPLTLIIGHLQHLIKAKKGTQQIQEHHKVIHRNANILLQLINQLLDFRKNKFGKLLLCASKNDLISFVENIRISFSEHAKLRNIDLKISKSTKKLETWFDPIKLQKILFNLLSNAFKFTPDGGKITVSINHKIKPTSTDKLSYVRIEIKDSGKGIPEDKINLIFDRFYQLKQEHNSPSSTGIGLELTKNLIELHHGKILVESTESVGTSFIILLPLGNSHLSEHEINNNTPKLEDPEVFYSNLPEGDTTAPEKTANKKLLPTILLVEDNNEVRNFIKTLFIDNYNICEAENGEIAIDIAKSNPIDIIISDIAMPIMDGMELCKHIKTNIITSHIPIILLTAKTASAHREYGYKIGADAYITKPFDANILELRVNNLLTTRKNLIEKFKRDILLEPKEITHTSADRIFLQKCIDIIEQNMSDSEFNVHAFIKETHMSRSVVFRKLKAITDLSISEFMRTIKLKKAGQLLSQTDMTVAEITYEVGFNDLKYFRKCFKKLFDKNPSNYRTINKKSTQND